MSINLHVQHTLFLILLLYLLVIILCHFVAQNEDEISCHAHDVVTLLEDLGDGWLRVRKGKDEGYVPQSYVQKN